MYQLKTPINSNLPIVYIHAQSVMDEPEVLFWEGVRRELNVHGYEGFFNFLVNPKSKGLSIDVPYITLPQRLNRITPLPAASLEAVNLSHPIDYYLKREDEYFGPGDRAHRINALKTAYAFYRNLIECITPIYVLVGNANHAVDFLLLDILGEKKIPFIYLERGPFPLTWHLDELGVTGGTKTARKSEVSWYEEASNWRNIFSKYESHYRKTNSTWWHQPTEKVDDVRSKLCIPRNKKIVLFANQLNCDTSNFLYAPLHETNLEAFTWLCRQLRSKFDDLFIIGKHHPMNTEEKDRYQAALGGFGVWVDDIPLKNCLASADYVVAVNSTVLYEALIYRKPCLMLGKAILSNKDIVYEITTLSQPDAENTISAWLDKENLPVRFERWEELGASLLSDCLFAMDVDSQKLGLQGPVEMVHYLLPKLPSPSGYIPGDPTSYYVFKILKDELEAHKPTFAHLRSVSFKTLLKVILNKIKQRLRSFGTG